MPAPKEREMTETERSEQERKEALKALRNERREYINRAAARVKVVSQRMNQIREALRAGPRTIPHLAESIGLPTAETLWYVMAMKKYGQVAEGSKDRKASYYPYELVDQGLARETLKGE